MEREVDVVVVGIGPAGSSACYHLAASGLSVVGLEKRQEIGAPKRCGEGLSKSSLERMGIDLPERCIASVIYGVTVYAPNGRFLRVDFPDGEGFIVERKVFDKYLATLAVNKGAKIYAKSEVIDVKREDGRVLVKYRDFMGEEKEMIAKVIVACDGVETQVARKMGMNTVISMMDIASAFQFEMSGIDIDDRRIELYFGNEIAPGGYVWIFPKGKREANVGIGVRAPLSKKKALDYLTSFVEERKHLKNGSIIEVNSGGVPVGGLMKNMVSDNLIIAGDAAHQVNPIHGGGISEAWVAGRIAAETIVRAKKEGDFSSDVLSYYNKRWWKERGKKLEKLVKLRKVVEKMSDEDLNWLADKLNGEDLVEFARSRSLVKLSKILIKNPKLMKFAKELL